ncbi:MAG: FAD-binding oxidoreductase [Parachlamydiaceae bacterium]
MESIAKYEAYEKKKQLLVASLQYVKTTEAPISLHKTTSNLFKIPFGQTHSTHRIDVRNFNQVLSIDPDLLEADVEGMLTYADLVNATLPYNLLPAIVPQLKTITVGGAVAGLGIESSSFRYGLVHESVIEMEILLSDGRTVICRADNEHQDLFYAFPNTYGTLGYALRLKIKLISTKKYIRLLHHRHSSPTSYFEALETHCKHNQLTTSPIAYIDGTIFSSNELYITTGEFVNEAPYTSDYTYMNIYYRSMQNRQEDFLSTANYIWRWDTDWFWCSNTFGLQNRLLRFLFGKWMLNSATYTKIMRFFQRHPYLKYLTQRQNQESVIQDILIPIDQASAFLTFLDETIPLKPIWICPSYSSPNQKSSFDFCPIQTERLYLDFGFWGSIPSSEPPGYYNRKIEQMAVHLDGLKSLYSSSFYTESEFWSIYNEPLYNLLKAKYDPEKRLPSLYDKIKCN